MAKHMIQLIDEPALATEMGARGRAYAREALALPDQIAKLAEVIERAVDGRLKRIA
jgi:hypothetical protein